MRRSSTLIAFACILFAGCKSQLLSDQISTEPDPAPGDPSVITELAVDSQLGVQLYLAPCENNQCPLQLRLSREGTVLSSETLDWAAPSPELYISGWPGVWRNEKYDLSAYTLGGEYLSVTTAIELVEMSPGEWFVSVSQSSGFEHVKRTHYVYAIKDRELVKAWSDTEGEGPYISDTAVVDLPAHHKAVLHLKGMINPSTESFDSPKLLRLSAKNNSPLLEQSITNDIPVVIASEHSSIAAARSYVAQRLACLRFYWVVSGSNIDTHVKEKAAVVSLLKRKEDAAEEISRLEKCAPAISPRFSTIKLPKE